METSVVRGRLRFTLEYVTGKPQHQFREEEVGDQNKHGSSDDRLRGGTTDPLRPAFHCQSLIATNRRYDEAVDDRLGQSLHQVRKLQNINCARPEGHCAQSKREKRDKESADQSQEIRHGRKEWQN